MTQKKITNAQLLTAIEKVANSQRKTDETLGELIEFLQENMVTKDELDLKLSALDESVNGRFGKLNHDLRDYIDRKLTELKGDLISLLRKGDTKAIELIKTLQRTKVITTQEADRLLLLDSLA
ncbi:hypothetical protein HON52_00285 [Candidatus Uhrbacteria bacterium]|jgi:hypothetical protein|nr:hypothetical protein [Candidatus Uhrbacteria bacterium]